MNKERYHINNSSNKRIELLHKISDFISLVKNIYLSSLVKSSLNLNDKYNTNKNLTKAIALKKEILENISNEDKSFKKNIFQLLKFDKSSLFSRTSKN